MATLTSSLIVKLIDGVSAPARKAAAALSGIGRAASAINGTSVGGAAARLGQAAEANAARMDELRGRMIEAAAVGYTLAHAIAAPIKAAMDFESAMADVKKVVDFETPQAFADMQRAIIDMSRRIPMAASGLTTILANAGQAGIAQEDLLRFTEVAAKVGVAFDISAETAGESLAKMKTALGFSVDEVSLLADAMNHLSNSQASSAADILDVVRRAGATGKMFGFSAIQTSAFASAMLSAGAESDVAATSFLNMGRALTAGGEATTRQRGGFARLGLDSVAVAKRMQKDAVATTIDVMERLAALPKHEQNAISLAVFGAEARALGPLLTNLDLLRESIGYVNEEMEYAGSSAKEYEARAATTANSLQLFRNRINALGIQIGTALMPGLNRMLEILGPIVDRIADFAEAFPNLTAGIVATTAALVAFRVAAIGAAFAATFMRGGLIGGALAAVTSAGAMKGLGALMFAPFLAFGTRIVGILQTIALRFRLARAAGIGFGRVLAMGTAATMTRALLALLNPIGLVRAAFVALRFAVIGTGIGAVLVGIAMAGAWIYNNWEGIGVAFEAFKGAFDRAIEPVRPALQPMIDGISEVFGWISDVTGALDNGTWAAWGIAAGVAVGGFVLSSTNAVQQIVAAFQGLPDRIRAIVAGVGQAIRSAFLEVDYVAAGAAIISSVWEGMRGALAGMVERIRSSISGAFSGIAGGMAGAAAAAKPKNSAFNGDGVPVGGGSGQAPPKRARGGYVKAGHVYEVNDDGSRDPRELFAPGRSGTVYPSSERRKLLGGAGGGTASATVRIHAPITIYGATDPNATARKVSDRIGSGAEKAMRGLFADLGLRTV